jgi:hypothetical protein
VLKNGCGGENNNKKQEVKMGFREKTKSPVVTKAESRLNGMQVIETNQGAAVNYSSEKEPLTAATMQQQIELVETTRTDYNKALKAADELSNAYDTEEQKLNDLCTKVLSGALAKFGDDSDEYEQLGGTRKSDRKKTVKKTSTPVK